MSTNYGQSHQGNGVVVYLMEIKTWNFYFSG